MISSLLQEVINLYVFIIYLSLYRGICIRHYLMFPSHFVRFTIMFVSYSCCITEERNLGLKKGAPDI